MTNAFKKAFTGAVAVLTMAWSIGVAGLVTPMHVNAAEAGDVIKGTTLSTVYYYGTDGSRYAFPNEKTYFTWYSDFNDVVTISDSALAAIPLAGNVVYRPGSHWIKIQSDPKTYAVTTEGTIRWIESEDVAEGLAGSDWNAFVDDVSDTFFVDYTVGSSLMSAEDAYEGALVASGSDTYLVWGGEKLLVTAAGLTANNFQTRFVLDGSGVDLSGITAGDDLSSEDSAVTDTAQLGGVVDTTGGLSVSLASDTAASATIPSAADAVSFVTYKLTATDGDVTVNGLTVKMNGLADVDNLDAVYLYEGDTRLTNGRSLNSTTRSVTFGSLGLEVGDGDTVYITVRGDVSDSAESGDSLYLSLDSASSVDTDSTVSGSFPVSGNSMSFSSTTVGTLEVEKTGTVSDVTLGEDGATIGKFKFSETGTEAASLEAVTFNVDQASDHSNYKLYKSSTLLATGTVSDELVTFVLSSPLEIKKGGDETLTLKADVGGQADDDIVTYIEENSDVTAVGGTYGFNMDIDTSGAGSSNKTTVSITGGDLTFAFNGPSSSDIAIDSTEQELLNFTITAGNWTEIQQLPITLTATGDGLVTSGDANYTNIAIRETDGTLWMGPLDLSEDEDTTETLSFDDYQTLEAGESVDLMVTVDVADVATLDADTISATLELAQDTDEDILYAEDVNGDEVTDVVPSADIEGYDMTITTSSISASVSSTPSSGTYVKGTNSVSTVGYSFEAGEDSDMTISEITFTAVGDSDGTATATNENDIEEVKDHISSCSVYDNATGALVDGPESFENSGSSYPVNEVTFSDLDWTVEAGETSKLLLKCNFSNNALDTGNAGNDAYSFFIANSDDVTVTNDSGDTQEVDMTDITVGGDVTITGTGLPVITDANAGYLTVAAASDMPSSTVVLGDSTGVSAAKYKFTATNEGYTIKSVRLVNAGGGTDNTVTAVTASYPKADGTTETKTGYLSSGAVSFDNMAFYVSTSSYKTLTVTVDTNTVSSAAATSGTTFELDMDMAAGMMEAVGDSGITIESGDACVSGTQCINSASTTDVAANEMTLHKTKPTLSLNSSSPSGSAIPGLGEVLRFNVAADSRGYVTLNTMVFAFTSTDNSDSGWNEDGSLNNASKFYLYNYEDMGTAIDSDWDFYVSDTDADGDDEVTYAVVTFDSSEEVASSTTNTYVLKVDTTGASSADDDALRLDIPDEASALDGTEDDYGAVSWDDDDTGVTADGSYLKNLPVNGGTLIY